MNTLTTDNASAFYQRVTDPTAKAVLDFLVDHPEERFNSAAIMERLGLDKHSDVARSAYYMGQILDELGLQRPWIEAQLGYLLPAGQADMLRQAREHAANPARS